MKRSPFEGGRYGVTRSRSRTTLSSVSGVPSKGRTWPACWCRRWISPNDRFSVSSASSIAAPMAPHQAQNGGTIRCDSSSSNVSRSASTTPSLLATAPMKRTGASTVRPLTTLLLKFCATARQSPRRISAGEQPFCCAWIMSDLAKTEQRPAMRAAVPSARTTSLISSTA